MTEALKMIASMAAEDQRRQVILVDISRAYFNAKISRTIFVELPPEAGYGKGYVRKLDKCMYGTRDAAQGWERTCSTALRDIGCRRGVANPRAFRHPGRRINFDRALLMSRTASIYIIV